jgi:hypothetical protein
MTNRRLETRLRSRGRFAIYTDDGNCIAARLVDTSPSGLCLEASTAIEPGTEVQMQCEGIDFAAGAVRYCRASDDGYAIGVAIAD